MNGVARDGGTGLVQKAAREALLAWYKQSKEANPTLGADTFFPVEVEGLAKSLGWSIEGVAAIGYWDSRPILGRCVAAQKRIELAMDACAGAGEPLFTLAHEVGHILLG